MCGCGSAFTYFPHYVMCNLVSKLHLNHTCVHILFLNCPNVIHFSNIWLNLVHPAVPRKMVSKSQSRAQSVSPTMTPTYRSVCNPMTTLLTSRTWKVTPHLPLYPRMAHESCELPKTPSLHCIFQGKANYFAVFALSLLQGKIEDRK